MTWSHVSSSDLIRSKMASLPFVDTVLAAEFEGPNLPPDAVAASIMNGMRRDRFEIRVGRVMTEVAAASPRAIGSARPSSSSSE